MYARTDSAEDASTGSLNRARRCRRSSSFDDPFTETSILFQLGAVSPGSGGRGQQNTRGKPPLMADRASRSKSSFEQPLVEGEDTFSIKTPSDARRWRASAKNSR